MDEKRSFEMNNILDTILEEIGNTGDKNKAVGHGTEFHVGDAVGVIRCGNCNCVRCWKPATGVITEICDENYVKVKKDCCNDVSAYNLGQVGRC